MHKIDGPGHVGGQFVSEDAATGRAPTLVTPEWLNAVQGELAALVTAAGLTLDKANSAQVLAALNSLYASPAFVNSTIANRFSAVNALRDSGRYFDVDAPTGTGVRRSTGLGSAPFALNAQYGLYTSTAVSVGKFSHDNSTYGGTGGALNENVSSLLTAISALKQRDMRYGAEFYVAEISTGQPTYGSIVLGNRTLYTSLPHFVNFGDELTFMAWVRVLSGSVTLAEGNMYKNGSAAASPVVLPGGWVHLSARLNWTGGYSIMSINAERNSKYQIALSAVVAGNALGKVHTSPVTGFEY